MKEHKIGTHITLEVVESNVKENCDECALAYICCQELSSLRWQCAAEYRTDHKNIIYKEVK